MLLGQLTKIIITLANFFVRIIRLKESMNFDSIQFDVVH